MKCRCYRCGKVVAKLEELARLIAIKCPRSRCGHVSHFELESGAPAPPPSRLPRRGARRRRSGAELHERPDRQESPDEPAKGAGDAVDREGVR